MSVEGGNFKCFIHGTKGGKPFEADTIDAWNKHCTTTEGHTEMGSGFCQGCGEVIEFTDLPFQPLGPDGSKNIQLRCDDCEEKRNLSSIKVTKKNKGEKKK